MKEYVLLLLLAFTFSCKVKNQSDYTVIKIEPTSQGRFADSTPTDLSTDEIKLLEELIVKCISEFNSELQKEFETNLNYQELKVSNYIIKDIYSYKRQYVPVISQEGEKIVWVNGLCETGDYNWQTELIGVNDGGNCYFNLTINLSKKSCYDIQVNGYA